MQDASRVSPAPGQNRDGSPSLSRNMDRLSLSGSRAQSPASQSPGYRRSASRMSSSSISSELRASTPGAYEPPRSTPRASSSLSHMGTSPRTNRRLSMNSQASPPRRDSMRVPSGAGYHGTALSSSTEEPEPLPPTAASVAAEYFSRDLALHESGLATAQVAVILHDACYGHRFSRPKTSKGALSMIVERPERVLAAVLGLCTAYVRIGSRHAGGQHAPHPDKTPGTRLPFKISKSSRSISLTSPFVAAVHGNDWMKELEGMCNVAGEKLALNMKELSRSETSTGQPPKDPFHEGDLYLCSESLDAFQGAIGGVCDAVDTVFSSTPTSPRRAFVAVRPPGHHCSSDFPSGFCWLNNVHIGIEYAAQTYGLTHAVILDIDLHHGDGSQDITWERNTKSARMHKNASFTKKTTIGYYSMHDVNSYPCEDGDREKVQNASLCIDNAHNQSIWNVHLEPWKDLDDFWSLYENKYSILLEKARTFLRRHAALVRSSAKQAPPKAAVFISAGFDASEWEGAGMQRHAVNVPTEFYARFAKDVVKLAHEEGTAVDGRVISVLEGGYSDRALTSGVMSLLSGLCQNQSTAEDQMANAFQSMDISSDGSALSNIAQDVSQYDTDWWDIKNLQALENHITPPPPPPAKRTQRTGVPTYATPTQSFTGKVVDPVKFNLSVSATMRPMSPRPRRVVKHPTPEVNWIVAVHELSKLIIPSDRQTKSHAPEDLAPPRIKKDRLSGPASIPAEPVNIAGGRQLRTRKTKTPETISPPPETKVVSSDVSRRQTISGLPTSIVEPEAIQLPKRTTRRKSNFNGLLNHDQALLEIPPVPVIPGQFPGTDPGMKPLPSRIKKSQTPDSSPILPAQPFIKQEARPELRRFASDTSNPPASIDYTKPINHIEPLRPAGIKRIHLKVGTREEHDRRQRDRELEQKIEVAQLSDAKKVGPSKTRMAEEVEPGLPNQQASGMPSDVQVQRAPGAPPVTEHSVGDGGQGDHVAADMTIPAHQNGHPKSFDLGSRHTPAEDRQQQQDALSSFNIVSPSSAQATRSSDPWSSYSAPPSGFDPTHHTAQQSVPPAHIQSLEQTFAQPRPQVFQNSSGRRDLPVFSSTGAIPFAPPKDSLQSDHSDGTSQSMLAQPIEISLAHAPDDERRAQDVWEIPEISQR